MRKILLFTLPLFLSLFLQAQVTNSPLEIVVQRGHSKPVTSTDVSPDGKFMVSGSKDFSVKLWSIEKGYEIRSFNYHSQDLLDVKFNPSGEWIASVAWDGIVVVQEVGSGKKKWSKEFGEVSPRSLVFSADGKYLLVSTNRNELYVLDSSTGKEIFKEKKPFSVDVTSEWIGKTSNLIPFYSKDQKSVFIKDIDGVELHTISPDRPKHYSFSPDDKYLVIGSEKLQTEVYDLESGERTQLLTNDPTIKCTGCGTRVLFKHSGNVFVSGNKRNGFTFWNARSGKMLSTIDLSVLELSNNIRHIEFSSDDKYLLLQAKNRVFVYEVKTGRLVCEKKENNLSAYHVHFVRSTNNLLLTDLVFGLYTYDFIKKKKVQVFKGYLNRKRVDGFDFDQNNWWSAGTLSHINKRTSVALSPDNKWIVKGGVDSTVFLIDFKTGQLRKKLSGHSKVAYLFKFSPDGKILATGGGDRKILLWNTESWERIGELEGHVGRVYDFSFNKTGTELISASWDGNVLIWDVESRKHKQWYNSPRNIANYCVSYLPGELYFIRGNFDKQIQVIERETKQVYKELLGHTGLLSAVKFDEEKDYIFTASWDGMLKAWQLGNQMMKYNARPHGQAVYCIEYLQDKKWLISGGADNEIQILDFTTKKVIKRLKGHLSPVTSVVVSSDQKYLVSGGADGEIKVWDLESMHELYGYNQINREDWLTTNPAGYFDGSKNALNLVNYVKGLNVVPISSLFNKYYTPNLSKRIMEGEEFTFSEEGFNKQINGVPEMKVSLSSKGNYVSKLEGKNVSKAPKAFFDLAVNSNSKGHHVIRVYRNGKLINNLSVSKSSNFKINHTPIRLVNGKNKFSFVAVTGGGMASAPQKLTINYSGEKGKTELFVVSVGMNKYQNSSYDLNFAVDDATAFAKTLVKGSDTLFYKSYNYTVKNSNKQELKTVLDEVSKEIGPEDVFVFFYAGHGVMRHESDSSEFFLVLNDVTSMHGDYEQLKQKGFSAHDLMEVSKNVSAEKQLFVIDACNSGGVLQTVAYRGAEKEKALAQLAHSTGTFYLTASQDAQYANEAWKLKHGVFTYCLLEALGGKDAGSAEDSRITVSELKSYVEGRVPVVSRENQGYEQYPMSFGFGQDFPIVILNK